MNYYHTNEEIDEIGEGLIRKYDYNAFIRGESTNIEGFITEHLNYRIVYDRIADIPFLKNNTYSTFSTEEIKRMIDEWNSKQFNGHYFEMFAVENDENVVGIIALSEKSESIVSIGPEIFKNYRNQSFGKAAMLCCMKYAKSKSYKLIVQQIRENNLASLALHKSLGFETDGYIYKNRHGNSVFVYLKVL